MSRLYPDYKPRGLQKTWEATSMDVKSTAALLRRFMVPDSFGEPSEAVAWFEKNGAGALRLLVADFPNGQRVTMRSKGNNFTIEFATVPA